MNTEEREEKRKNLQNKIVAMAKARHRFWNHNVEDYLTAFPDKLPAQIEYSRSSRQVPLREGGMMPFPLNAAGSLSSFLESVAGELCFFGYTWRILETTEGPIFILDEE